jgi:16S rRNA (guanine527-N7)-methyltransferase
MGVPRGTLGVSPELEAALARYADLVRRWSGRANLTSARDLARFEQRHIADCLRIVSLVDSLPPGPGIDVGSGSGLPGVVLALAGKRPRHWRLLEPGRKRAAFLEETIRTLDLDAEVLTLSAEEAERAPGLAAAHRVATARALAPPTRSFALLRPLVGTDGVSIVFTAADADVPEQAEMWAQGVAIIREARSTWEDQ